MNIDDLLKPKPPERIYGWLDTQLSLARFYGSITFQGHAYFIDKSDPGQPLVRADIIKAESKAKKQNTKQNRRQEKAKQEDIWTKSE